MKKSSRSTRSSRDRTRQRSDGGTRTRRQRTTNRRSPSGDGAPSGWTRHGTALPSWTDLEPPKNRKRPSHTTDESFLQRVSTVRFAVIVLVLAATFTLYVGHVHATKDLLNQVQEARAENQRLHLKRNRLEGEFARKTSPSVIYERARELGLRESVTYGPPVSIDE